MKKNNMWVTRKNFWQKDMTSIEKFLAERFIQRCDYDESISKKHRTINGYTQLKELVKLCELTYKRIRTNRTLSSILIEAKSKRIKQNIRNDRIIQHFFTDLKDFITGFDEKKIDSGTPTKDLSEIRNLHHQLKIYEVQLDKHYFKLLKRELLEINYNKTKETTRVCDSVSDYIDLMIPYLLYEGYSISSINEVIRRWIEKGYRVTITRVLAFFGLKKGDYDFLIRIGEKTDATKDFISLIKKSSSEGIRLVKGSDITEKFQSSNKIMPGDLVIRYTASTIDPNAHIRSKYDSLLKKFVIGKDRKTLSPFTNHFEDCYWMSLNHKNKKFNKVVISGDPISVPARKSTLRTSLLANPNVDFKENSEITIPQNHILQKGVYYYNLALGSKSMENSLSLLWTSLETVLPYRIYSSDIECVKHILGKSLSIGSIIRDFYSIVNRIDALNNQNSGCLDIVGIKELGNFKKSDGLENWYKWITDTTDIDVRFNILKNCSELLAYEYLKFARPQANGRLGDINNRIQSSKESIEHQLQRIYLHRNQIVHSGELINEYSNLWLHLEWYVGKILYYSIIKTEITQSTHSVEEIFRELEAEYDYMTSYMEKNPEKKCKDSIRIIESLLELSWQAI